MHVTPKPYMIVKAIIMLNVVEMIYELWEYNLERKWSWTVNVWTLSFAINRVLTKPRVEKLQWL